MNAITALKVRKESFLWSHVQQDGGCCLSGEWLCWPCKVYEEEQRAMGAAQSQIRPPRWEVQGGQLQEGSKAVQCALCPVKQGAFRRTADGKAWIHEVWPGRDT